MPKSRTEDCKGITLNKRRNRWEVTIIFKKNRMYLGSYKNKKIARAVWEYKRDELYGVESVMDLDGEVWIHMNRHRGDYYVSNKGRVKNLNFKGMGYEKLCNPIKSHGYRQVKVNRKNYFIHRLVLQYFVGESDLPANHKDGNRTNNLLENLEYITHRCNGCHGYYVVNKRNILTGAHFDKWNNCWRSEIRIRGQYIYLGVFATAQEANEGYMQALLDYGLKDDYEYIMNMINEK